MLAQEHAQAAAAGAPEKLQRRRDDHRARLEQRTRSSADPSAARARHRFLGDQARLHAVAGGRVRVRRRHVDGPPVSQAGSPDSVRLHERARSGRRVRPRLDRPAQRRQEVGEHLDAAHPDVLHLHPLRERHRPDSGVRRPRPSRSLRAAHRRRFVRQAAAARRHDGDGQLQRDGRAGHDHVRRHHRRRVEGARLRQALEEPGAARAAPGRSTSS